MLVSRIWHLRAAILTVVGALALHQGRYLLAPPTDVHSGAHTYFAWAIPLIGVLAVAGALELALRLSRSRNVVVPRLPQPSVLFVLFAFTLLTIFGAQETLETVFSHGSLPVSNPFIADGAWVSIPLAVLFGAILTLLLRGVVYAVTLVASRRRPTPRPRRALGRAPARLFTISRSGISRSLAPRGPPAQLA